MPSVSPSSASTPVSKTEPIPYAEFRTGLRYVDVYYMIYTRKHKRRNGVLGYWKELKQRMYNEYLHYFHSEQTEYVPSDEPIPE